LLTTATLRKNNMLEILRVIRKNRLISRPEIAHQTKLTSVTVSTLTGELVRKNIVSEEGYADSAGGRKAVLYSFNNSAYHIIGINLSINVITIDLFDLGANKVFMGSPIHLNEDRSVEDAISALIAGVKQLIADSRALCRDIIGIGVTLPGRIDYENGVVCHLTNLKNWVNIPLKRIIESETGIPTYIERDVNAHISYLKWLDVTENRPNVVYCSIGEGIGAAVMIDGSVYHGDHGLAGEIGHTTLDPDGPRCNCGNNGCVEVFAANRAIIEYYRQFRSESGLTDNGTESPLSGGYDEAEAVELMARSALAGDAAADRAFSRACRYISACVVNIINTYNPSMIILDCRWMRTAKKYFDGIVSGVFGKTALLDRSDMKIILNPVGDIFGQASSTVVLEQLFSDADNNRLIG
jgi:predicted NBD/HSP70 family sugar kinase